MVTFCNLKFSLQILIITHLVVLQININVTIMLKNWLKTQLFNLTVKKYQFLCLTKLCVGTLIYLHHYFKSILLPIIL